MRGEPKTQREIISTLGNLPEAEPVRCFDRWKSKTLENRHVVLLLTAFSVVFIVGFAAMSRRQPGVAHSHHVAQSSNDHANNAVHFSRDRPLRVLVIADCPPVDNNENLWSKLIGSWDSEYGLVVILSPDVRISRLRRLDATLKKISQRASKDGETRRNFATWFVAAQSFADNGGTPFYPSSPRLMVTCTFHSLVFGHEVEFLSSISTAAPLLKKRLSEGQGEVNSRFLILPPKAVAQTERIAEQLGSSTPFTAVWTNADKTTVLSLPFERERSMGMSTSFETSVKKPCVVQPFDVSDYKWKCIQ